MSQADNSSSNHSQSSSSWLRILGFSALALTSVASAAALYSQYTAEIKRASQKSKKVQSQPAQKAIPTLQSGAEAKLPHIITSEDAEEFAYHAVRRLNNDGMVDVATIIQIKALLADAVKNIQDYSPNSITLIAQFMLVLYNLPSLLSSTSAQMEQDLSNCWSVLCSLYIDERVENNEKAENNENVEDNSQNPNENPSNNRRETNLLRVDVAQRLYSAEKMLSVYADLASVINQNDDELLRIFMAAPLLGKFQDFLKYGKIIQLSHDLLEFRLIALQQKEIPDYQALFKLLQQQQLSSSHEQGVADTEKENNEKGEMHVSESAEKDEESQETAESRFSKAINLADGAEKDIVWHKFTILGVKKEFQSCISVNSARESEINSAPNKPAEWKEYPDFYLDRQGCIFRMQSTAMPIMPICGVINGAGLFGSGEFDLANDKQEVSTFSEYYAVKLVQENNEITGSQANQSDLSTVDKDRIYHLKGFYYNRLDVKGAESSKPELLMNYNIEFKLKLHSSNTQKINIRP
jgi:hypothetical protein